MPKISKIRIINFSYNGDKRLILDELFNLHQGEDALISLKNGGGKSVLVQALMQPILPNLMLQKRKMSDFFVRKKQPAYILIEWKLDQDGGSLLTGIAMMSKESTFQEQEEGAHTLRYFTFTASYRMKDAFDIRNLPLTTKENNRVLVKNYTEAQRLIQDAAKKRGGSVFYFSEHESRAYKDHLVSYNIHPDEWKTVMLPMNSEEGGLIKIFEKCKTPRMLLREWIIPTVNKVIFNDTEETQSLQVMMGNLAQSMIDNESFVLERDLLKGFYDRLEGLSQGACKAAETQSSLREKEEELRALEQFLHGERRRLELEQEETANALDAEKKERFRIDQEKGSEEYYQAEEAHRKSQEKTMELQKIQETILESLEKVRQEILLLEARQIYDELLLQGARKTEIETELRRLTEPSEDQEMRERVAYSLKRAYALRMEEVEAAFEENQRTQNTQRERKGALEAERQAGRKTQSDLTKQQFEINKAVENYEQEERELTKRFGQGLQRNLMGGLDEGAAKSLQDRMGKDVENLAMALEKTNTALERAAEEEDALQQEIPALVQEITRKEMAHEKLKEELQEFLRKEEELLQCLHRYGLPPGKRYQKEYLLQELKTQKETVEEKLDHHKEEIRSLEKRRSALDNGILHVSQEFQDHLKAYDIEFETGENYLQRHTLEIRQRLLQTIPLLPYAFLLTEEELGKVKLHPPERPLLQPVPLLTYGSLEGEYAGEEYTLTLGAGKVILCYPDLQLFESGGVEAYQGILAKQLRTEGESKAHYEDFFKHLLEDELLVRNFTYGESYEKEARKNEEALAEAIQGRKDRQRELRQRQGALKEERRALGEQKTHLLKEKEQAEKNLQDLERHLSKNNEYEFHLQQRSELEAELQKLTKRMRGLEEEEQKLSLQISHLEKKSWDLERQVETLKKEKLPFEGATEKPLTEGTIEELLAMYRIYQDQLDGNLSRLQKELQEIERVLRKDQERLLETGVPEGSYRAITYQRGESQRLKDEKKRISAEAEAQRKIVEEAKMSTARLQGVLQNVEKSLREKYIELLERQEIHGNYAERTSRCKAMIKTLEEKQKVLDRRERTVEGIQQKIGEKLRESKVKVTMKIWSPDRDVESGFQALSRELSEGETKLNKERSELRQNFWKLKEDYKEKHTQLTSILYTVEKMHDSAEKDPENYYYLYESAESHMDNLQKLIRLNESKLEYMEKSFQDMVVQSYHLAKEIFDHVNRITDDSSIQLDGRSRKVKMIEILLRELEPEDKGMEVMRRYIKERAEEVKVQLKAGKTRKDVQELIAKFMSSEELLNVISDLSDLRIKAYKVDINANHSQAKDWEKVMRENSGGERFVSFFAVMIALMSYARNSRRQIQDYHNKNKDSKVLLMDNPFGPISSDHLLKPLFEISKKYNTQLICLTDLKQNSIMNQFKVIFMMKIVPNTSGTMEYLKVEESTASFGEDSPEENLEMLSYHYQQGEQMSLLGDENE